MTNGNTHSWVPGWNYWLTATDTSEEDKPALASEALSLTVTTGGIFCLM